MTDSQDTTAQEIWKPIPDYPGYEVSDHGQVRSFWKRVGLGSGRFFGPRKKMITVLHDKPKKILKQNTTGSRRDYLQVNLCKDVIRYPKAVHRLVLEAFVCPCPSGLECCHDDGNSKNNHLSNLRWGTKKNNESDKIQHGTIPLGANVHNAKITEEEVIEIRRLFALGHPRSVIALNFQISSGHVWLIVHRKRWKHLP